MSTYEKKWLDTYIRENFLPVDPTPALAKRTNFPFNWGNLKLPRATGHAKSAAARVMDTVRGDNFRIKLDGQVLDNRGVAGELLLRRAGKIKFRLGEDIRLGTFAGFDLFIRAGFNNTAELVLRGRNSYSTRVTDTALGTIRSLEATAQGFEERATRLESDIKDSQKRAVELEAKVGSPFEKEKRYHHLVKRQSEIEEKLDLTKNQAPAQAESAADDEVTEENSQYQTQVKTAGQNRRAAIRV